MRKLVVRVIRLVLLLIVVGILAVGYSFLVEPKILLTKQYTVEKKDSAQEENLRVVQISDLHIGEFYDAAELEKLVKKVNRAKPDVVVFTGDLYDNYAKYQKTKAVEKELSKIQAVYGKYAIWGNRDYGGGAVRVYENVMASAGFTVLKNESETLELSNGKTVGLSGLDDSLLGNADVEEALRDVGEQDFQIVMTHEPDVAESLADSGADLLLAGHSHGGQVRIPFVEMIHTSLAEVYTGGFYEINEQTGLQLFVNTGIGTTRIPARFMVPPQIAVFDISF